MTHYMTLSQIRYPYEHDVINGRPRSKNGYNHELLFYNFLL